MGFCTNCGAELAEASKFCTECGEKIELTPAPAPVAEEIEYAPAAAAAPRREPEYIPPVEEPVPEVVEEPVPEVEETPAPKAKKASPLKWIIAAAAAVIVIAALVLILLPKDKGGGSPTEVPAPQQPNEPAETPFPLTSPEASPYTWWNDQWYGWWIVDEGSGYYADWEGDYWDAYAIIDDYGDGSGWMELWDVDYSYDSPMVSIGLSFSEGAGEIGCATALSGYFMDAEINPGDIVSDPDAKGFDIENMIFMEYHYVDPANSEDSFTAFIFLRPWGQYWDDVENGGDENWPYGDMMPMYYHDWYLPLMERGYTLPFSYQEGVDILTGAANEGSGEVLASAQWDDCLVEIVGAEHFVDWDGKDAIRVYYDFTNLSDTEASANDCLWLEASQEGYTQNLTSALWSMTVPEVANSNFSLRPGVTIRCVSEFNMKLTDADFELVINNYWDESKTLSIAFDPNDLPGRPPLWEEEIISNPKWVEDMPEGGKVGEYYVSIDHVELMEDYEFKDAIRVVLDFTNNSSEESSLSWALLYSAYQNGIELDITYPAADNESEFDYMLDEYIQPGETITIALCYALRNQQSPVEFEVYDYWTEEAVGAEFELAWGD